MRRALPAVVLLFAGLGAFVACSDPDTTGDDIGGGATEGGSTSCTSTRTCGASSGSTGTTSSGSSGQTTSSGGGGSSGASSSSSGGEKVYTRIEPAANLQTRSAGCGNANPSGRGNRVNVWDGARSYITYPPEDYQSGGLQDGERAGRGYPLLVALHGCEADAQDLSTLGYGSFQDAVGSDGVVIYPEAQNAKGGCGWSFNDDQAYLDAVLADAKSQYCIDETRVIVLGFSFGGYMSQAYSCNRPGTVKALISAASGYPDGGWGYFSGTDVRECGQIPTLIYGRTHDSDESIGNSYHARDQRVTINQCDGSSEAAYWPFNDPGTFGTDGTAGCVDYNGCLPGRRTTFCEDQFDLTTIQGSDPSWNHTLWQPYHPTIWAWANNLAD
jgi:hypothetical protein